MQPTSILAMLLAGAALTVAAPGAPTYGSGNAQCPSGYTGADCTEKSPVSVGGNGGSGYYPGGNGGSDSGGNGGSGSGGSGSEQPFTCSQSNGLLQGSAQCCQTNILGVASLTCDPIQSTSFTQREFSESCAQNGRVASCCLLPAAGLAVACQDIATGQFLN